MKKPRNDSPGPQRRGFYTYFPCYLMGKSFFVARSKTYLGAQFRRLRTRLGSPIAIEAMAAKLARLVYCMLRYGMKCMGRGAAFYEVRQRELQSKRLKAKAEKLGYRVTPIAAAA